jgi:hypothetical protein
MSTDPNQSSQLSKSASSSQSRTKAQANPAPEPSSPAEPMTENSPSILATPPTRIVPSEAAESETGPEAAPVSSKVTKAGSSKSGASKAEPVRPKPTAPELVETGTTTGPTLDSPDSDMSASTSSTVEPVGPESEPDSGPDSTVLDPTLSETPVANEAPVEPTAANVATATVDSTASSTSSASTEQPTAPASAPEETVEASDAAASPPAALRNQPIPPASEPMQYRAIGLVRGKYTPSEEQFTRGFILTDDEVLIDAVLLGRVMSLVKKHINLEESHLWVVYPRTREKDLELHMQIVGIWEPEKLNRNDDASTIGLSEAGEVDADEAEADEADAIEADEASQIDEADAETEAEAEAVSDETVSEAASQPTIEPTVASGSVEADPESVDEAASISSEAFQETAQSNEDLNDRYFSVRGEVVFQSDEEERLLVKIRRAPKPGETEGKAFKVALKGTLQGKALGYFWDMQVQREGSDLTIQEANQIGLVPPQKRKAGGRSNGRPPRRGPGGPPRRGPGGGQSGPPRRRWDNQGGRDSGGRDSGRDNRPYRSGGERPSAPSPTVPRQPISKPVKRPKEEQS